MAMVREDRFEDDDLMQETVAILKCLEYLRREAMSSGLDDAARYIAMAADSVHQTIAGEDGIGSGTRAYFPGIDGSGPH